MILGVIMKNFTIVFLFFSIMFIGGCKTRDVDYAAQQLRNIAEVAEAGVDGSIPQEVALGTIKQVSETSANHIDPEQKVKPVTTAKEIAVSPEPELKKVLDSAKAGPSKLAWGAIVGVGVMALGLVGKFLGPPFNIIGSLMQTVAGRVLPNYDRDRKAAMGTVVALDQVLTHYGSLLDAMPETKKILQEKLGADPVKWMKIKLSQAHQDLGVHTEVSAVMSMLKKEVTTENGVLAPAVDEFDKIVSKKI